MQGNSMHHGLSHPAWINKLSNTNTKTEICIVRAACGGNPSICWRLKLFASGDLDLLGEQTPS